MTHKGIRDSDLTNISDSILHKTQTAEAQEIRTAWIPLAKSSLRSTVQCIHNIHLNVSTHAGRRWTHFAQLLSWKDSKFLNIWSLWCGGLPKLQQWAQLPVSGVVRKISKPCVADGPH